MPFDIFLSHNSGDTPAVRDIAKKLKARGLNVWFDEWELRPGEPWQAALEREITNVRAAAVFVGKDGIGPWEGAEVRGFLSESVQRGIPIIPVLLPGAPTRVELPLFLRHFTWVDLRNGLSVEGLDSLIWGITGRKPGLREDEGQEKGTEPKPRYRPALVRLPLEEVFTTVGLPRFTYIEPDIYPQVAQSMKSRGKHVVVEGPSGVGKTCLVFRILGDLGLRKDDGYVYRPARNPSTQETIVRELDEALKEPRSATIVLDDFHILDERTKKSVAERLKALSDQVFLGEPFTRVVLIGIPASAAGLLYDTADLGARLTARGESRCLWRENLEKFS